MRTVAPETGWTNTHELLAALIEVTDYGNRLYLQVHSRKGSRQPKPIKIRRPGEQEPRGRGRQATGEEMRRFFGGA